MDPPIGFNVVQIKPKLLLPPKATFLRKIFRRDAPFKLSSKLWNIILDQKVIIRIANLPGKLFPVTAQGQHEVAHINFMFFLCKQKAWELFHSVSSGEVSPTIGEDLQVLFEQEFFPTDSSEEPAADQTTPTKTDDAPFDPRPFLDDLLLQNYFDKYFPDEETTISPPNIVPPQENLDPHSAIIAASNNSAVSLILDPQAENQDLQRAIATTCLQLLLPLIKF